jgi:hypothetical protein
MLGGDGTFAVLGRTASASVLLPYAWGTINGSVGEASRSVERSGLADARLRLSINVVGGPALPLAAFAQRKPSTIMGTSVTISVPTGEYAADKLINLGSNRWGFKPEVGVSHPTGPWTLELYTGCWFFTRNPSGPPGLLCGSGATSTRSAWPGKPRWGEGRVVMHRKAVMQTRRETPCFPYKVARIVTAVTIDSFGGTREADISLHPGAVAR